jgi:hypothetical protein
MRPARSAITRYDGGRWYDGTGFAARTVWTDGDRLRHAEPGAADAVVDLDGGWVVPPYGEAHTHWLEPGLAGTYVAEHLRAGVFYVRDQSMSPRFHAAMRLDAPDTVDLTSPHQGFTGPGGHPAALLAQLAALGVVPAADAGDGGVFRYGDVPAAGLTSSPGPRRPPPDPRCAPGRGRVQPLP